MTLRSEVEEYVAKTFRTAWTTRNGYKVPDDDDIKLTNDGVRLEAVVLYADLADSTDLVKGKADEFAAEIYKNYLYCASRIIRSAGGTITAFDGDRVMAVYIGDSKNSMAAQTALRINRAVTEVINPALKQQYPFETYRVSQKVGIDASSLLVAKTGIRGSNDLVWVGNSANNAAKMSTLSRGYASYISGTVYNRLNEDAKWSNGAGSNNMWTDLGTYDLGYRVYGSTWMQSF